MSVVRTAFLPDLHGYHFVNRFDALQPLNLPLIGSVDPGTLIIGLCGGMCFAALDDLYRGTPIPPYIQEADLPASFVDRLYQRQRDSLSLRTLHRVFSSMLRDDADLARLTREQEIPHLRALLDSGSPAVLCLIKSRGLNDPTQNHQVVAEAYEYDPISGVLRLYLYDPNHPDMEPYLDLPPMPGAFVQSTGERWRGFFINTAYRRV